MSRRILPLGREARNCSVLWLAVLLGAGQSYSGPSASEVEEWLDSELAFARVEPSIRDLAFKVRYESHLPASAATIERLRREVANKPDHPDRVMIEIADKHTREGPFVSIATIRCRDLATWRVSMDRPGSLVKYEDVVVTPELAWSMNAQWLTLVDPRRGWPESARLDSWVHEFTNAWDSLVCGGLRRFSSEAFVRGAIAPEADGRWRCRMEGPAGERFQIDGRWSAEAGRGFVTSVILAEDGQRFFAADWKFNQTLGRWVAGRAEFRYADGSINRRYVFESAEKEEPSFFDKAIKPPKDDGVDAIRGDVTFTAVHDYTARDPVGRRRQGEGVVEYPLSDARAGGTGSFLQYAGWLGGAGVVIGLIGWRIIRRHERS